MTGSVETMASGETAALPADYVCAGCGYLSGASGSRTIAAYYSDSQAVFGWESAMTLAEWECGWKFAALAYAAGVAVSLVALWFARPVTRWFVRNASDGEITGSSVFLWTCDGLQPPCRSGAQPMVGSSAGAETGEESPGNRGAE